MTKLGWHLAHFAIDLVHSCAVICGNRCDTRDGIGGPRRPQNRQRRRPRGLTRLLRVDPHGANTIADTARRLWAAPSPRITLLPRSTRETQAQRWVGVPSDHPRPVVLLNLQPSKRPMIGIGRLWRSTRACRLTERKPSEVDPGPEPWIAEVKV
jgi:hypothetical protein